MTHDEKLATIFGVSGIAPIGSKVALEYEPEFRPFPSALLAWYFATVSLFLFPAALVAVPLAFRAGRQGNRLAYLAAAVAIVSSIVNVALILSLR